MLDLLQEVIAKAEGRCSYAEARHEARLEERVAVRNGTVDHVDADDDEGIGIRVRVNGAWGFAATRDVSPAATEAALREARAVAEALPPAPRRRWRRCRRRPGGGRRRGRSTRSR